MSALKKSRSSSDDVLSVCAVRVIYVYCIMLFDKISGKTVVWTYENTDDLLDDLMSLRADPNVFPSTFVHKLLVTSGHPLFEHAQPLHTRNNIVVLPK